MQRFASNADARAKVSAALGSELGVYHYKPPIGAPATIPAIWVVNNVDTDPPSDHRAIGVECLIFPPPPRGDPLFGNVAIHEEWEIRLIQHDRSKDLKDALVAMLRVFRQAKVVSLRQSTEINEQANLYIKNWSVV